MLRKPISDKLILIWGKILIKVKYPFPLDLRKKKLIHLQIKHGIIYR